MTGDQKDFIQRIRAVLPRWFADATPVLDALLAGIAQALAFAYSLYTYAKLQTRIRTASEGWLDVISADFLGTTLPRLANEGDDAFRARILANLFVKGPTRRSMNAVLTLVTGRAPTIVEPSNTTDTGGWDSAVYWDKAGCWGDPLPFQSFVTAYRPDTSLVSLAEWDAYRFSWDAGAYWSDQPPNAITDAALIAAVESTRALASVVWMRIANSRDTGFAAVASPPAPAPAPAPTPAPSPAPAPAPSVPTITVADEVTDVLLVGDHIVHTNEWGKGSLTRGTYTGLGGTTYEQQIGVAYPPGGSQDPIALRIKWAWPSGPNEVKSFPSVVTGNFPGWYQPSTPNIAGTWPLRKQDGTYSTAIPSGKTPNSVFPIALPVTGILQAQGSWVHNATPTGRGHLSWDIWVQDSGPQGTGFTVPPIHTEIMIPLTYWGGYGQYIAAGGGRNPNWYWGDDTIDGYLWHIFQTATTTRKDGSTKGNYFNGSWHFIVFEPDSPTQLPADYQPNLKLFLNYAKTIGWLDVPNPVSGNVGTHVVSAELGVECVEGTGDVEVYNFRIRNT